MTTSQQPALVEFGDGTAWLTDLGTVYHQWMLRAQAQHLADRLLDFHIRGVLCREPPSRGALIEALDELQGCEARYREKHDLHGDDSLAAGQAWDHLRRAGHRSRLLLNDIKEIDHGHHSVAGSKAP